MYTASLILGLKKTGTYSEEIKLGNLNSEKFWALAIQSIQTIGWSLGQTDPSTVSAVKKSSDGESMEEIIFNIYRHSVKIQSKSIGFQNPNIESNKENVCLFIETLNRIETELGSDQISEIYKYFEPLRNQQKATGAGYMPLIDGDYGILSIFIPRENYFITPVLIWIHTILFIMMVVWGVHPIDPSIDSLILWGGNSRSLVLEGDWWRLLSNFFIHIGLIHLFVNMYALLFIGMQLEPYLGKIRMIASYFLAGLAASVTSIWWHENTLSAGASGAIFGLYGVYLVILSTTIVESSSKKSLITSIGIFVVYNLVNGLRSGIDNAAHIGGLLSGLIMGLTWIPALKRPDIKGFKMASIILVSMVVFLLSFILYKNISNDILRYNSISEEFYSNEKSAMNAFNYHGTISSDSMAMRLFNTRVFWEENIDLTKEVDNLNISNSLLKMNTIQKQYYKLRLKSHDLYFKAYKENTDDYNALIDRCNRQILDQLNILNKIDSTNNS